MIHEDFHCEFFFIRHGQSGSNATPGVAVGANFDSPLTALGEKQARRLGRRLRREKVTFDRVYSSTLARAIRTTELMLEEMGEGDRRFEKIEALKEQQIPAWRGKPDGEIFTPETLAYMRAKEPDFVPADGEPLRLVQRRVATWIEDEFIFNRELTEKPVNLRVAIVGHGAATKAFFQHIMNFDAKLITRMGMDNCSISRFMFNRYGWFPVCINDGSHIHEEAEGGIGRVHA
ncbi:MAG: histidine phosphatase family protein [SAR202 cluster bacterium]|nr:histidine phosphatase family protein [SAR202 cluster bacterium]